MKKVEIKRDIKDVTTEDIQKMANLMCGVVSERVNIDAADEEAIYDDLKSVLVKYLY